MAFIQTPPELGNQYRDDRLLRSYLERTLGHRTEPHGTVETRAGVSWVRGAISWFGGPNDTGVGSTETGAVTGERLRRMISVSSSA